MWSVPQCDVALGHILAREEKKVDEGGVVVCLYVEPP